MRRLLSCTVLAALMLSTPALAAEVQTFSILKDGEPIGRETVTLDRQGDTIRARVQTTTAAKLLFLNFKYDHDRTETWQKGQLTALEAVTDDDGSKHAMAAKRVGDKLQVTVDGTTRELPGSALPLSLWTPAILDRAILFSVIDAQPYAVKAERLGAETVDLPGRSVAASHVRIGGEVERDLWYGEDGQLLRARFLRRGFTIDMIRQ